MAELEKEKANVINSFAVKNLVELSEKYHCKLIHFSTDYVYCGLDIKTQLKRIHQKPLLIITVVSKRNGEMLY